MVEELWARIRGADKWPEVVATVTSVDRRLPRRTARRYYPESCTVLFFYSPPTGNAQSGRFKVDSGSALYHLEVNENFRIQFDPAHPARYYSKKYRIPDEWKGSVLLIAIFGALMLYIAFSGRLR